MKTRFHEQITRLRKEKEYTQAYMAEQLGISRSTYSNYEAGKRSPDYESLEAVADILECSLDELFGREAYSRASYVREDTVKYGGLYKGSGQKKLGIGVGDFRKLREWNSYYVDKTGMIEEFLESNVEVTLITRPRRFGKTLNMSMLAEFFDCTRNSEKLFEETYISQTAAIQLRGQYPVVFMSFLNAKGNTKEELLIRIYDVLLSEYERYWEVLHHKRLSDVQREKMERICSVLVSKDISEDGQSAAMLAAAELCRILESYYKKKVYLLIDEYDTPFISANVGGYYNEVRSFLSVLFSSALKGNSALEKAMLTGIQRAAKENIFSGLNNISVCTVGNREYAEYFGFTEEETRELLAYYGMELTQAVKEMYDGYLFGHTEVYNPWSVTCYASRRELESYWVNTSENSMIEQAMDACGESFQKEYEKLLELGKSTVLTELENSFYEKPGKAALWGMLINAGMVTIRERADRNYYIVSIPNKEVGEAFQKLTAHSLRVEHDDMLDMTYYLKRGELEEFVSRYQRILMELPSYHDLKDENSYHMMMLGMCAYLYGEYEVKSNRESGSGRSDLILCSLNEKYFHVVLEFKYAKDAETDLSELAQSALEQIKDKKYAAEIKGQIYYIGLAHCGKKAEAAWERTEN